MTIKQRKTKKNSANAHKTRKSL